MYNVVIADDDRIILRGLRENIPWERNGFHILATVDDSRCVEKLVREQQVDLLLLDIDMPYVTGLEIARRIRAQYPHVVVLLLTAHDDFQFAREAIRQGVQEYLLKPISREAICAALARARWKLDHEHAIALQLEHSRPVLLEQFWKGVLDGSLSSRQEEQQAEMLQLTFASDEFIIINIYLFNEENSTNLEAERLADPQLICNVQEMVKTIFSEPEYTIITGGMDRIILLCCCKENKVHVFEQINQKAEKLRNDVERYTKAVATIGVGDIGNGFRGIRSSYQQSEEALCSRRLYGNNRVFFIQDVGSQAHGEIDWDTIVPAETIGESMDVRLQAIRAILLEKGLTEDDLMRFCVFKTLLDGLEAVSTKRQRRECLQLLSESYCALQKVEMLDDMIASARQGYQKYLEAAYEDSTKDGRHVVDLAIDFLQKNYMQPGLKQSDVAHSIYVSPTYLSTVFKRHLGQSFNEYLMELRINKALHLLDTGHARIYEIAERVGFISPQYFSVCFKKRIGKTPSEICHGATEE